VIHSQIRIPKELCYKLKEVALFNKSPYTGMTLSFNFNTIIIFLLSKTIFYHINIENYVEWCRRY